MLRYTIRRLFLMIPTLLGVAVLVFLLLRMLPGDIVELRFLVDGGTITPEALMAERQRLGLDKSLVWQFYDWMTGIFVGDFGISMWTGRPVIEEIGSRLGLSLQVAIMATVLAVSISIPLGTVAALFKNTWIDHTIRVFAIAGLAVPSFWLGMLIILALLWTFNWIPPLTYVPIWDPLHPPGGAAGGLHPHRPRQGRVRACDRSATRYA
jgi:peptide/nickel transport system permease protein